MDGVAIGKLIRELDPLGKIIYVTSHTEMSMKILKATSNRLIISSKKIFMI